MSFILSVTNTPVHVVVWQDQNSTYSYGSGPTYTYVPNGIQENTENKLNTVSMELVEELRNRITELEKEIVELKKQRSVSPVQKSRTLSDMLARPSPYFTASSVGAPVGLEVLSPSMGTVGNEKKQEGLVFQQVLESVSQQQKKESEVHSKEEENTKEDVDKQEQEEQQEEEVEEEQEEEQEEEEKGEKEEEEQEEEEVEEAQELVEFEYKGVKYYRDNENQVYQLDDDGDLDDTPIGVWNEDKQKVLKYKV